MSWHHGDYLSLAQAIAGVIAIGGAFGVVFTQEMFQRARDRRSQGALRYGIESLAQRANTIFERITNRSLAQELGAIDVGSLEVEKYRMSIKRRTQAILASIDLIPLSAAADAGCVDVILYLRQGLTELDALFGDCVIDGGQPTGPAAARFLDAHKQIALARQELGLVPKTVFDASREIVPGGEPERPVADLARPDGRH